MSMRIRKYKEAGTRIVREEMLLSRSEQESEYERSLSMVLQDARWVLDNLEHLDEYRVNWKKYQQWKNGKRST